MHNSILFPLPLILCSLFAVTTAKAVSNNPYFTADNISINCGSTATSTSLTGQQWLPDVYAESKFASSSATLLKGSSSNTLGRDLIIPVDPIPYKTARISRFQFSYTFQLNPGQKLIRLHFNPTSYDGFDAPFSDLFTVEAGPFTLLANFSASITARAVSLNTFVKEYCINIQQSQPFDIVFSPERSQHAYAFINGIEIISLLDPSSLSYCHGGDIGVQVVGQKSVIYIDNTTALELVHRRNIKPDSVSSQSMILLSPSVLEQKADSINWKISVDVGFSYLVKLHFNELGLKMTEVARKEFIILINHVTAVTSAEILQERQDKGILGYKNYMVMMKGHKREGKRDIFISLHSKDLFVDWHGPIEGFKIFKLSNNDNSLASPNPLPLTRDSPSQTNIQILLSFLGWSAIVFIAIICLLSIIVHIARQNLGAKFNEEENKLSTRAKRICRRFSLAEIQSATDDFHDAFIIGRGGFSTVYKGIINNGQETVAVKRMKSKPKQGKREFWTEIEMISQVRHVNLVSLIGYCNEQQELILVYEYIPDRTLADHLYKLARKNKACSSLSWNQRLKICIGVGRGLDYLHTGQKIIHRDVKTTNILLDKKFVAKVSDFGLAKFGSGSESQSQASTKLKGTFGYMDPDYFRTCKLTTKSDTYSFGVVLLEVLCGRPAVERWVEEDKRSLTMWAQDKISKGEMDQIVDPSLRGKISLDSLKVFVSVVERCLDDKPKKRPAIAHVVINLEFALELQENAKSSAWTEIANVVDVVLRQVNAVPLVPSGITNVADAMALPPIDKTRQEKAKSLSPNEITSVANALPCRSGNTLSDIRKQLTRVSFKVQNVTSTMREQINSKMINAGKKDGRKTTMQKLVRLRPWDALRNKAKPSKKKDLVTFSKSAPVSRSGITISTKMIVGNSQLISNTKLRSFHFLELKAATRNFSNDTIVGEGGFGTVYKGWLKEESIGKQESESMVAVKKLNHESMQGFEEWQTEVNFLVRFSHPNLVKLLGYCWEDKELLLVFEFMQKGSLENHLFGRGPVRQPLTWDIRLKILIGAARGLAFLHASDLKVIHRDFKAANILLDGSYHAKISDFGIAKMGPTAGNSHVTTQVMGTHGYAAPEYVATGHLYVKSDVYGFGVVLVEMLTGLWALDTKRPAGQHNLVDWVKPYLPEMDRLKKVMDSRLEGRYPNRCALQVAQLALNCLEYEPRNRPSMQEIVETLERIDSAVENDRQPRVCFS